MGVSFGVTDQLYRFWQRAAFEPLYVRLTANETTGERTCIMVRAVHEHAAAWLPQLQADFQRRLAQLLGFDLRAFSSDLALRMLHWDPNGAARTPVAADGEPLPPFEQLVAKQFSPYDRARLDAYARSLLDYHVVLDLVPPIAQMLVSGAFGTRLTLSWTQARVLVGMGLQRKSLDDLMAELELPANQLLAFFNKSVRRVTKAFRGVDEARALSQVRGVGLAVCAPHNGPPDCRRR